MGIFLNSAGNIFYPRASYASSAGLNTNTNEEISFLEGSTKRNIRSIYDSLLWPYKMAGADRSNEFAALRGQALSALELIKVKYPAELKNIVSALNELYGYISECTHYAMMKYPQYKDIYGLDLALSFFKDANLKVKSLIDNGASAREIIVGIKQCLRELTSINERKAVYQKYGTYLVFNSSEMNDQEMRLINQCQGWVPDDDGDVLTRFRYNVAACWIDNELNLYPRELYCKFPDRMIVLQRSMEAILGAVLPPKLGKAIYVTLARERFRSHIHHELFHRLHLNDPSFDNSVINWRMITGSGRVSENQSPDSIKGYASDYGMTNEWEDMATVAGMIYGASAEETRSRLSADPILETKVELITGCEYDPVKGMFVKVLTKEDLMKKYVIPGHFFYAKWSNVNGKVLMDENYWNGVLKGNHDPILLPVIE